MTFRARVAAGVFATVTLLPTLGRAEPTAPSGDVDPRARAEQLFDAALADIDRNDAASACPKFRASYEIDPKPSTMLNLASCFEQLGQTASAWGAFREAAKISRRSNHPDWAADAEQHAKALESRLIRLTLDPPAVKPNNLAIARDGVALARGEWGLPIPIDPGPHELTATAPAHRPWRTQVRAVEGTQLRIAVPSLMPEPSATTTSLAPPSFWTTGRVVGTGVAGIGVVAVGVGAVLGALANASYEDAQASCQGGNPRACDPSTIQRGNDAYDRAGVATGVMIGGAVVAVAGAALFFLLGAPKPATRSAGR